MLPYKGKCVLASIIKALEMGRLYLRCSGWVPNVSASIFIREKLRKITQMEEDNHVGRDWSDAATSQGMLQPPEAETQGTDSLLQLPKGAWQRLSLISVQ